MKRALVGIRDAASKRFPYMAAVAIFCALVVLSLSLLQPYYFKRINRVVYDSFLKELTGGTPSEVPILIDIDEKSLKEYGQWPWPRYRIAELLVALCQNGVCAVGVDILMTEPDRTSPKHWKSQLLSDFGIEANIDGLPKELMDNDKYLADIIKQLPVIMPALVTDDSEHITKRQIRTFPITELRAPGANPLSDFLLSDSGILMPIPQIAESAPIALMNAEGDVDGIFRSVPLMLAWDGIPIPGLALATLALGAGDNNIVVKVSKDGPESLRVAGIDVPISDAGMMPIAFRGGSGVFPRYSATDILNGKIPPEKLAGRIAFLGSTIAGLKDLRATPFDSSYPGLELHAAAVDTILSKRFVTVPSWIVGVEIMAAVLCGAVCLVLFSFTSSLAAIACGAALIALTGLLCKYVLLSEGIYVSPTYPVMMIVLQAFLSYAVRFWLEERDKRVLRKAFSNYVSPEIVERIIKHGRLDSLRGENREVSVLFTDIRGFTGITEKMPPTQVVDMLARYFAPMTVIVRESTGTLDKFIGDALMAFWNAPLDVPDHPRTAVRALLDMHSALDRLNTDLSAEYGVTLRMGGGIHTGHAHIGNMGTSELMSYTAIGDTVNTASRLEGMCSKYGLGVVISEDTADRCGDEFTMIPVDIVRVKGRSEGIKILSAMTIEEGSRRSEELDAWRGAFAYYVEGDFKNADNICSKLTAKFPDEKLYQVFKERTAELMTRMPEKWDGVFTYENK